jgi:hypothetical protein
MSATESTTSVQRCQNCYVSLTNTSVPSSSWGTPRASEHRCRPPACVRGQTEGLTADAILATSCASARRRGRCRVAVPVRPLHLRCAALLCPLVPSLSVGLSWQHQHRLRQKAKWPKQTAQKPACVIACVICCLCHLLNAAAGTVRIRTFCFLPSRTPCAVVPSVVSSSAGDRAIARPCEWRTVPAPSRPRWRPIAIGIRQLRRRRALQLVQPP